MAKTAELHGQATTKTAGQQLAAELRRMFSIGTRTRRARKGQRLIPTILYELCANVQYAGCNSPERTAILRPGFPVSLAWSKHVDGCRIDGFLHSRFDRMTPYQFCALLGRMVDAGVTNNGEGERFFDEMTRDLYANNAA